MFSTLRVFPYQMEQVEGALARADLYNSRSKMFCVQCRGGTVQVNILGATKCATESGSPTSSPQRSPLGFSPLGLPSLVGVKLLLGAYLLSRRVHPVLSLALALSEAETVEQVLLLSA